jgi:ADP-L-glycero-D-manno-heptose 6-epimerase
MKPNDFSDARVLVTGGAGFIGSSLVWALNRRGCRILLSATFLVRMKNGAIHAAALCGLRRGSADLQTRLQSGALGNLI